MRNREKEIKEVRRKTDTGENKGVKPEKEKKDRRKEGILKECKGEKERSGEWRMKAGMRNKRG